MAVLDMAQRSTWDLESFGEDDAEGEGERDRSTCGSLATGSSWIRSSTPLSFSDDEEGLLLLLVPRLEELLMLLPS